MMSLSIGEHVLVDENHPGTIRYIGPVEGHEGEWIGIEWWYQQGKHQGTYRGKTYFQTKKPLSGSFIRSSRISLGHSFSQSIYRQYIIPFDQQEQKKISDQSLIQYSLFGKHFEDYRLELSSLIRIDLSTQWVKNFHQDEKEFYQNLHQVKELNIRRNLLERTSQFWNILDEYFPNLEIFNLSNSRIIFDENPSKEYLQMKELVLIDLDSDLEQLENVCQAFPNLESLHLDKNLFTSISTHFVDQIEHLTHLSLSDNPRLKHWNPFINRLGKLQYLEELFLNNCGIQSIEILHLDETKENFPRLKSLYLSENEISEYQSIEELSKLKCLQSLSLLRNPLYSSNENQSETSKQLIIARLPSLIYFNRVFIQRDERRGAEIDYLQFYAKDYFQNLSDFHQQHRQYQRLIDKYGEPHRPTLDQNVKKGLCIRPNMFEIIFEYQTKRTPVKKIPSSMTIAKLKTFLRKLYPNEFDSNDQSFHLSLMIDEKYHQILNDDFQDLQFYFDQKTSTTPSIIRIEKS